MGYRVLTNAYSRKIKQCLYDVDKTRFMVLAILDIREGADVSASDREAIINHVKELKRENLWDEVTEQTTLAIEQLKAEKRDAVECLTAKDKALYNNKRKNKLELYDWEL